MRRVVESQDANTAGQDANTAGQETFAGAALRLKVSGGPLDAAEAAPDTESRDFPACCSLRSL